jgi:hypothetical protein
MAAARELSAATLILLAIIPVIAIPLIIRMIQRR